MDQKPLQIFFLEASMSMSRAEMMEKGNPRPKPAGSVLPTHRDERRRERSKAVLAVDKGSVRCQIVRIMEIEGPAGARNPSLQGAPSGLLLISFYNKEINKLYILNKLLLAFISKKPSVVGHIKLSTKVSL